MERLDVDSHLIALPAAEMEAEVLAEFVARNRAHLAPFLPAVAAIDSPEAARAHLATTAERVARGELWEWHLFAGGVLCGGVRLNFVEPHNRKASIAYYLDAGHQGRGLASAAVRAVLAYAFSRLEMHRIELRCAVGNVASRRLAERLGFVREGELRDAEQLDGGFVNHYVYSLLASERPACTT